MSHWTVAGSSKLKRHSIVLPPMKTLFLLPLLLAPCVLESVQKADVVPKFEDYRVTEQYSGKNAKPVLSTPDEREFRTRLREAAQDKVNFAGHYVLTAWGCGAQCLMGAVIDARTGKVYWLPSKICCWPLEVEKPLDFRIDSRLVILTGSRDEEKQGVYYYKFQASHFTLLQAVEKK